MGKSSPKPPSETTSNVFQSSLPEYARPYFENLLNATQAEMQQPYIPYGGPRIQGFNEDQEAMFGGIRSLNQMGAPTVDAAAQMTANIYNPAMAYSGFQAPQVDAAQSGYGQIGAQMVNPAFSRYGQMDFQSVDPSLMGYGQIGAQRVGTQQFPGTDLSGYMNPYVGNVIDRMQAATQRNFLESQGSRDTAAQRAGAYGGSRAAIENILARRNLDTQLGDQTASLLNQGYQQAVGQFNQDQQRSLQAALANQGTALTADQANLQAMMQAGMQNQEAIMRAQQLNQQAGLTSGQANLQAMMQSEMANQEAANRAQQLNQGANLTASQANLEAMMRSNLANQDAIMRARLANQQAGLQGADIGLRGLGLANQSAQQLGSLGRDQQNLALQRLDALRQAGLQQQQLGQTSLDQAYQDFVNQNDYARNNLAFYSGILRGIPVSSQSSTIQYAPSPNTFSSALGGGINSLAYMNALQGNAGGGRG